MKSSYHVRFCQILRQSEFHFFRVIEGSTRHLACVEWLTVCHMSSGEPVKQKLKWGSWESMIGWKSKVDGYMDKGNPREPMG